MGAPCSNLHAAACHYHLKLFENVQVSITCYMHKFFRYKIIHTSSCFAIPIIFSIFLPHSLHLLCWLNTNHNSQLSKLNLLNGLRNMFVRKTGSLCLSEVVPFNRASRQGHDSRRFFPKGCRIFSSAFIFLMAAGQVRCPLRSGTVTMPVDLHFVPPFVLITTTTTAA